MPLKRREVEAALEFKGFKRTEGDHAFFIYYTSTGRKTTVRTKTSHGTSHNDISHKLVSTMARQCKLTTRNFRDLVACPLTREGYEEILLAQELIDPE